MVMVHLMGVYISAVTIKDWAGPLLKVGSALDLAHARGGAVSRDRLRCAGDFLPPPAPAPSSTAPGSGPPDTRR